MTTRNTRSCGDKIHCYGTCVTMAQLKLVRAGCSVQKLSQTTGALQSKQTGEAARYQ